MGFVEEKDELRLRRIAGLRQLFKKFRQHPKQERRVKPRVLHQFVGDKDIDHATSVAVDAHEILK